MKRTAALLAAIVCCLAGLAYADYSVSDRGEWPESWPKELEPLREQARTLEGPLGPQRHYAIHFTNRDEFESAWPHLLKVKGEGAPLVLARGNDFFLGKEHAAGVVVHSPLPGQLKKSAKPADAKEGDVSVRETMDSNYYIVLVVDGDIVDLNRIQLPDETPILDKRFEKETPASGATERP